MSLPLAYCLVIAPINILLKSFKASRSFRSILSTSSDSKITSARMNFAINECTNAKQNDTIYESMASQLAERC